MLSMTRRLLAPLALVLGLALNLTACGSDKVGYAGRCTASSDCEDGLICPTTSYGHHTCTKACSRTSLCEEEFGEETFCGANSGVCLLECSLNADCEDGTFCDDGICTGKP